MLLVGSPSLAVTETVTFAGPSGKVQSKLLAAAVSVLVPEPQDSVTVGFGSSPGSERSEEQGVGEPSFALASPESTTVGATLATATTFESEAMLLVGSPSLAVTETVTFAGPSGKVQSKLLAAAVSVLVPEPQDSVTVGFGSSPGSETAYV